MATRISHQARYHQMVDTVGLPIEYLSLAVYTKTVKGGELAEVQLSETDFSSEATLRKMLVSENREKFSQKEKELFRSVTTLPLLLKFLNSRPARLSQYLEKLRKILPMDRRLNAVSEPDAIVQMKCVLLNHGIDLSQLAAPGALLQAFKTFERYKRLSLELISLGCKNFWSGESFVKAAVGGLELFNVQLMCAAVCADKHVADSQIGIRFFKKVFDACVFKRFGHKPAPSEQEEFFDQYDLTDSNYLDCMSLSKEQFSVLVLEAAPPVRARLLPKPKLRECQVEPSGNVALLSDIQRIRNHHGNFKRLIELAYLDFYTEDVQRRMGWDCYGWWTRSDHDARVFKCHEKYFNSVLSTVGSTSRRSVRRYDYASFNTIALAFLSEYRLTDLEEVECLMSPALSVCVKYQHFNFSKTELLECVRFPEFNKIFAVVSSLGISKEELLKMIRPVKPVGSSRVSRV